MRFAFMGTPDFAATALTALLEGGHRPVAVYTRAPQRSGRGQQKRQSPVHAIAAAAGIPVYTPSSLRRAGEQVDFAALDLDYAIVVAYGLILPAAILDAPRLGCFNLHGSLLPRWRGAAPIQRAIMAGDHETGVQVMRMEVGLDTGPVIMTAKTDIRPDDTFASLHDRLADAGSDLLKRFADQLTDAMPDEISQSADGVLYADKITSAEAAIDWARDAQTIDRQIRGLSPFPGAFFMMDDAPSVPNGLNAPDAPNERGTERPQGRVKALMSRASDAPHSDAVPGTILAATDVLTVACGSGAIDLLRLQRAGRGAQDADAFLRGVSLSAGQRVFNGRA